MWFEKWIREKIPLAAVGVGWVCMVGSGHPIGDNTEAQRRMIYCRLWNEILQNPRKNSDWLSYSQRDKILWTAALLETYCWNRRSKSRERSGCQQWMYTMPLKRENKTKNKKPWGWRLREKTWELRVFLKIISSHNQSFKTKNIGYNSLMLPVT